MNYIIGMQVHFLQELEDEGIDKALSFLKTEGSVNSIFIASQHDFLNSSGFDKLYHNEKRNEHKIDGFFFNFDQKLYESSGYKPIRCKYCNPSDKDIFKNVVEKAKNIGLKTYAMILNRWPGSDNYPDFHMRSINNQLIPKVFCANNPSVNKIYRAIIKDLLQHYDIDGIFLALLDHYVQFGFEHLTDELAYALGIKKFKTPEVGLSCFCKYCVKQARKEGINVESIKSGLLRGIKLDWIPHRVEGLSSSYETFNFLIEVPEYLEWMRFRAKQFAKLHEELYNFIKKIKPDSIVALNTYGPGDSWKYAVDYCKLVQYCDWVKPMFYSGTYPGLPRTPDQIRQQTHYAVEKASNRPVISGINGIGSAASLETIENSFRATIEGGAKGIILSWDYALIPLNHIRLFGTLVKEVMR